MNKLILLLLFLLGLQLNTQAQNSQIEAKAAYLLAEESFAKGDYISTLEHLETAIKNLGTTNSKLLFLKIQAELEIYKTDKSYYEKVINSMFDFQNASDVGSFAEEKVLEIAKTKMFITKEREKEIKNNEDLVRAVAQQSVNFEDYAFTGWPFGITLDELKISHKDSRFFKDKIKDKKEKKSGLTFHYPKEVGFGPNYTIPVPFKVYLDDIFGILTYDNIVKGYRKTIYHVSAETENMSLEKSLEDIKAIITNISAHVGFTPEYEELDKYYSIYSWSKDSKIIKLYIDSYVTKNGYFYKRVVKEITIK